MFDLTRFARQPALVDSQACYTYADVAGMGDGAVGELPQAGDLVAIECDNTARCIAAYCLVQRQKLPTLLTTVQASRNDRESLYERFRVSVVYLSTEDRWTRRLVRGPDCNADLAVLLSTSGSTGSAKLVRLSHSNLLANAESIAYYLAIKSSDRAVTSLPLHYSYGLSILHSHLVSGASLAVTDESLMRKPFWDFLRDSGTTSFAGVPSMYDWLRRLKVEDMDLPSLHTLTQAGGRLSPAMVEWFAGVAKRKGWRFFVMYGQTEATARMAYLPPRMAATKPGAIGVAIPHGRLTLVDESGNSVPAGTPGELVYEGPNVMMGYAESIGDLARGDDLHGRLVTGDIATCDDEGIYTIVGRKSRFLKIFGNRVALDDIEEFLDDHGIAALATGRDDCLVLVATSADIAWQARDAVLKRYGFHHSAVKSFVGSELPRTSTGKIRYGELIAQYETHGPAAGN